MRRTGAGTLRAATGPQQVTTGRGYNTVRAHLKHIFAKPGVSRQLEVAQAVIALSGLPPNRN